MNKTKNYLKNLLPLLFSICLLACLLIGCHDENEMKSYLNDRISGLFTTEGTPVEYTAQAGNEYTFAINTEGMESIKNRIILYYGYFRKEEQRFRAIEIKLDPAEEFSYDYPVAGIAEDLYLRNVIFPDIQIHNEVGFIHIQMSYKKAGSALPRYHFRYFNLVDNTADSARVVNDGDPLTTIEANFGYMGVTRPDAEIAVQIEDLEERFLFATGGYADLNINYLGRQPFPAEGSIVAEKLHDYTDWWNGLSHELAGTSLEPLDPIIPADMELIKTAWYETDRPQLKKDIEATFGLPLPNKSIMMAEALYWFAGGATAALVPYYNSRGFMEEVDGVEQWGVNTNLAPLSNDRVQKIALHEFGHLFGNVNHPPNLYDPDEVNWEVKVSTSSFATYANLMHQGGLDDYPTDRFYIDENVTRITQPHLDDDQPYMHIPYTIPVGDSVNVEMLELVGQKDPNAAILVNGGVVVAANPESEWTASVPLAMGLNRLDIAQVQEGRTSHPEILYVTRVPAEQPPIPDISIVNISNSGLNGWVFTIFSFMLHAEAASGLDAIWWFVEKETSPGVFEQIKGQGHWRKMYGSAVGSAKYRVSFDEAGTYRVFARARDKAYPVAGEQHQSELVELIYIVED